MKNAFLVNCATFLSLVAAGMFFSVSQAAAQEEQTGDEAEEVVVVGAPIQRNRQVDRGTYGTPVEVIELSRQVSYADLDLSKYADVMEMEARIEATAKESCEKLSDMFRLDSPNTDEVKTCTQAAIKEAKERLQVAVAAANPD